jgi:hypothetical protein
VGVLHRLANRMRALTYSTSFSGWDTPGTAICIIAANLTDRISMDVAPCMQHIRAMECNVDAQEELRVHPHAAAQIHTNIMDVWTPCVRQRIEALEGKVPLTLDVFLPIIRNVAATDLGGCPCL